MMPDAPIEGSRMSSVTLSAHEVTWWVQRIVVVCPEVDALFSYPMRPTSGYTSLVS